MPQTCWACVHGDLHGSTALVSASGSAVVVDYGDVAEGPASLDPVTLELSLILHPQGATSPAGPQSIRQDAGET
jgi:Ser/Thr protein kinase RdoA (MazF antagonist)